MSRNALPSPKWSVARSASEIPSRLSSACIRAISGSPRSKRLRSVWLKRIPGELGKALAASSSAFMRLGLAAELHEQRAAVGDRVLLGGAGQGGGAVVGRERRLEVAHRLKDLAHRIVRLGALGRLERGALCRVERLVEPVERLQRQRPRRERPRMPGREGEKRVERPQRVSVLVARRLDCGEIDIGVGEARVQLQAPCAPRPPRGHIRPGRSEGWKGCCRPRRSRA